ncbi:MAG: metal-dependent transcriptional regulator [Clostridia bacterium]|nr:metal-dependent transcriptional regulator [Clostridia bacterium]
MLMKESGEMYLENILRLSRKLEKVRAIDVAETMNFSKPSVSRALSILKKDNCLVVDSDGQIVLTEKGRSIAEKIYERHVVLTDILKKIGVSEETAEDDACKIEHYLSDETFEKITECCAKFCGE